MIKREIEPLLHKLASQYPALAITGPRQSGKTTLARMAFPQKAYVSLENPDIRELATQDPRAFLAKYADGAIFDEVQNCPALFCTSKKYWIHQGNPAGLCLPALDISARWPALHSRWPVVWQWCICCRFRAGKRMVRGRRAWTKPSGAGFTRRFTIATWTRQPGTQITFRLTSNVTCAHWSTCVT